MTSFTVVLSLLFSLLFSLSLSLVLFLLLSLMVIIISIIFIISGVQAFLSVTRVTACVSHRQYYIIQYYCEQLAQLQLDCIVPRWRQMVLARFQLD